ELPPHPCPPLHRATQQPGLIAGGDVCGRLVQGEKPSRAGPSSKTTRRRTNSAPRFHRHAYGALLAVLPAIVGRRGGAGRAAWLGCPRAALGRWGPLTGRGGGAGRFRPASPGCSSGSARLVSAVPDCDRRSCARMLARTYEPVRACEQLTPMEAA